MVDCCPEKIILVDSKGRIISEEMLTALAALIIFKKQRRQYYRTCVGQQRA